MKGTVRIIAGNMRGKAIPFINNKFGNADITTQKVKGALFSILGENLDGKVFVDLFAGSGQIGFEALSRGASSVIFVEADRSRFNFIKDFAVSNCSEETRMLLNMKAAAALKYMAVNQIRADVIFADPPYEKIKGTADLYSKIIETIADSGILADEGVVVIQHFSVNELPEICCGLMRSALKKYGTSSLSIYRLSNDSATPPV